MLKRKEFQKKSSSSSTKKFKLSMLRANYLTCLHLLIQKQWTQKEAR